MQTTPLDKQQFNAMITLLEDPDEGIYKHVEGKFLTYGYQIIPHLEEAWEDCFDEVLQHRIGNIISTIQFENISKDLKTWAKEGGESLLDGMIIISRYSNANLNEEKIRKQLSEITQDVWLEINDGLTALEKIKIVNHILYNLHVFTPNKDDYHSPDNSYLNHVLNRKTGNPISLSIVYMLICEELGIPVYGIDLPMHFILGYADDMSSLVNYNDNGLPESILFYINPFSNGALFGKNEIDNFLKEKQIEPDAKYYKPCSNIDIIKRVLRNLIHAYERKENSRKVEELKLILQELNLFL
ncbi:MAG: transglutaminase-like domain-containing protein [Bacteroidota bacterium]|jgi:regulator of sirC expression with transglutaminase-like and TPR domain